MNPIHIAQGVVNDLLNQNEEILKVRRQICELCSFYDASIDTCKSCGCPIARKGRVLKSKCPIKKW